MSRQRDQLLSSVTDLYAVLEESFELQETFHLGAYDYTRRASCTRCSWARRTRRTTPTSASAAPSSRVRSIRIASSRSRGCVGLCCGDASVDGAMTRLAMLTTVPLERDPRARRATAAATVQAYTSCTCTRLLGNGRRRSPLAARPSAALGRELRGLVRTARLAQRHTATAALGSRATQPRSCTRTTSTRSPPAGSLRVATGPGSSTTRTSSTAASTRIRRGSGAGSPGARGPARATRRRGRDRQRADRRRADAPAAASAGADPRPQLPAAGGGRGRAARRPPRASDLPGRSRPVAATSRTSSSAARAARGRGDRQAPRWRRTSACPVSASSHLCRPKRSSPRSPPTTSGS